MNGQGDQFNQVGVRSLRLWVWQEKRLALFQQDMREIFQGAGNHQASIGKIETLGDGAGKIECFCYDHVAGRLREIKRDVIAKHTLMIKRNAAEEPERLARRVFVYAD